MWVPGKEYNWKLLNCMSKYIKVANKAKLLNMFYSSLTNRNTRLNLKVLCSLEFHIQNMAEVSHSTTLSTPGSIPYLEGPHEHVWTSQPAYPSSTSFLPSLCPNHAHTGNMCSLPYKYFLERTNLRNRPKVGSASECETVLGREFLCTWSIF